MMQGILSSRSARFAVIANQPEGWCGNEGTYPLAVFLTEQAIKLI